MNVDLVPLPDVTPLPGPIWLFQGLLVLTFVLHLLFMNLALGGTILAAVAQVMSRGRAGTTRTELAGRLMAINTYGISFAITTGIAPLLFIQILYQQYFYTATLLIPWAWFSLVILLMVGYYSVYLYKFKGAPARGAGGTLWLVLAAVLFLGVAMVQVAVNLLHSQPGTWATMAADPWKVLADPTYFPRLLHFVFVAVTFSALVVTWWSVRQVAAGHDSGRNREMARLTWRWALWTSVVMVVDGFVFLFVLPREVVRGVMRGGVVTLGSLGLAILLGIGLLVMLARTRDPSDRPGIVTGATATMGVLLVAMAITRHQVRDLSLQPTRDQFELAVAPQWGNFFLFAVLLVGGVAVTWYMVHKVLTSRIEEEPAV